MSKHRLPSIVLVFLVCVVILFFVSLIKSPHEEPVSFVVVRGESLDTTLTRLHDDGFIRSVWMTELLFRIKGVEAIEPGSYHLASGMGTWGVVHAFINPPDMRWVTIQEGLRKEEIAAIFQQELEWGSGDVSMFLQAYTARNGEYQEGVYFPDTYLIPVVAGGQDVASRMINRFEEVLASLEDGLVSENIKWDTAVTLASLVQREAASAKDMPLIAGILWNRLLSDMRLEVDATVQYARGDVGDGWWAPLVSGDTELESPYNTYRVSGLPPTPISNPGRDALEAVIYPEDTSCFFYIHDADRNIHCAETFAGHRALIERFLQ